MTTNLYKVTITNQIYLNKYLFNNRGSLFPDENALIHRVQGPPELNQIFKLMSMKII